MKSTSAASSPITDIVDGAFILAKSEAEGGIAQPGSLPGRAVGGAVMDSAQAATVLAQTNLELEK